MYIAQCATISSFYIFHLFSHIAHTICTYINRYAIFSFWNQRKKERMEKKVTREKEMSLKHDDGLESLKEL